MLRPPREGVHSGCEPEEPRNDSLVPRLLMGRGLTQLSSPKEKEPCYGCWDLGHPRPLSHGHLSASIRTPEMFRSSLMMTSLWREEGRRCVQTRAQKQPPSPRLVPDGTHWLCGGTHTALTRPCQPTGDIIHSGNLKKGEVPLEQPWQPISTLGGSLLFLFL